MKILGVAMTLLAVMLILYILQNEPKKNTLVDFGNVKPMTILKTKINIANNSSSSELVSGLDDACGLKAKMQGNPILLPGETRNIEISIVAPRRAGPNGTALTIITQNNNQKKQKIYQFIYNVVNAPWASKSEIWLNKQSPNKEVIEIYNLPSSYRLTAKPLMGISTSIKQHNKIELASDAKKVFSGKQVLHVTASSPTKSEDIFIPIFWKASTLPRVYPSVLYVDRQIKNWTQIGQVVGNISNKILKTNPNCPFSMKVVGDKIYAKSKQNILDSGKTTITVNFPDLKHNSTAEILY